MCLSFILFSVIVVRSKRFFKNAQDLQGEVQNYIMETWQGKQTIQNYQAEDSFIKLFEKHSFKELHNFYFAGKGVAFARPLIALGIGLSLLFGAYLIKKINLDASYLIFFSGFLFLLMEPLMYASWIGVVAARSKASWKRVIELICLIENESYDEKILVRKNESLKSDSRNKHFRIEFLE